MHFCRKFEIVAIDTDKNTFSMTILIKLTLGNIFIKVKKSISTVKLGFKERLDKEQLGNREPFPVTNMPVYLINSEQIGFSEQLCDDH